MLRWVLALSQPAVRAQVTAPDLNLPLSSIAFTLRAPSLSIRVELPAQELSLSSVAPSFAIGVNAVDAIALTSDFTAQLALLVQGGTANITSSAASQLGLTTQESAQFSAQFSMLLKQLVTVQETVGLDGALRFAVAALSAEGLSASDASAATVAKVLLIAETMALADAMSAGQTLQALLSDRLIPVELSRVGIAPVWADTLAADDAASMTALRAALLGDLAALTDTHSAGSVRSAVAADTLGMAAMTRYTAVAALSELLTLLGVDQAEALRLAAVRETVSLRPQQIATLALYAQLLDAMTLTEIARHADLLTAQETVALVSEARLGIAARVVAPETLALAAGLGYGLTVVSQEQVAGSGDVNASVAAALLAEDALAFMQVLPLEDGDYQAWAMNADTLGVTQYTQFPFESLATHEGRAYGLTETGFYALEGDDDEGAAIDAHVRTGLQDFGTVQRKRVPRAYLYVHSSGALTLKTVTDVQGERTERWYSLSAREHDTLTARRVKLGRGVAARSWAFEVANVSGGTLDVRDVQVFPVVLNRRV